MTAKFPTIEALEAELSKDGVHYIRANWSIHRYENDKGTARYFENRKGCESPIYASLAALLKARDLGDLIGAPPAMGCCSANQETSMAAPVEEFEVMRVLVLSIAHISKATNDWIIAEDTAVFSNHYGFLIYANYSNDELNDESKWPDDLKRVSDFASQRAFTHFRLDCDANQVNGLPTFDW